MNPKSAAEAKELFAELRKGADSLRKAKAVVCAPSVFISELSQLKQTERLLLGAQNVFTEDEGSYTGEVSASMLKSFGVEFVICGHSERRAMGETDDDISRKAQIVRAHKMTPVVCVGEEKRDDEGEYLAFLEREIVASLARLKEEDYKKLVIAYEPIWAIGADEAMDGAEMHGMTIFIRKVIADSVSKMAAEWVSVIYGGSVDGENIEDILSNGVVDGVLPGRASRDSVQWKKMCEVADKLS